MKTIGIIGGMSWHSTSIYYAIINQSIATTLGGHASARLIIHSINFAELVELQKQKKWGEAAILLGQAARSLETAGADFFLIASNTMHKIAADVQAQVSIPLLHIGQAIGEAILARGQKTVGLLGTRFTMQGDFIRGYLQEQFALQVMVPDIVIQRRLDDIIFRELALGQVLESSRVEYQQEIARMTNAGAEGIVLGCTEIGLLIQPEHAPVPLFDTAEIHAGMAARWALEFPKPVTR